MPTDYRLSARVFLSNQKPTAILQFAIQEEERNAEYGARLKNFHSSNLLCICLSLPPPEEGPGLPPLIFRPNKKIFWGTSPPPPPPPPSKGLDDRAPTYLKVWIRHRNQPIFSCNENPFFWYLVIYSSLLDLPSHSHGQFAIEDNDKNKTIVILSSSLFPSGKLPVRM